MWLDAERRKGSGENSVATKGDKSKCQWFPTTPTSIELSHCTITSAVSKHITFTQIKLQVPSIFWSLLWYLRSFGATRTREIPCTRDWCWACRLDDRSEIEMDLNDEELFWNLVCRARAIILIFLTVLLYRHRSCAQLLCCRYTHKWVGFVCCGIYARSIHCTHNGM